MNMKKFGIMIGIVLFGMMLSGCKEEPDTDKQSLILMNNEEIVEEYDDLEKGVVIDLPVLEEEGLIFLGWSDGEEVYYDEYTVEESITLTAIFEDIDDVFLVAISEGKWREITSIYYTGEASVLTIPSSFDGVLLEELRNFSVDRARANIKEIKIPKTVTYIQEGVFSHLESLEKISFYGEYHGEDTLSVNKETYEAMLEDYGDVCEEVNHGDGVYFEEPCPIKEVLSISDTVIVGDKEIITYGLMMDKRFYDDGLSSLEIGDHAFIYLPGLKEISFPDRYRLFEGTIFEEVPSLTNVSFGDSDAYSVVDGVVYSKDMSTLYYYPSGLTMEEYRIPASVRGSGRDIFDENDYLKELFIPANYHGFVYGLSEFRALEAIHVEEANEYFFSDEGVLYSVNQYNQSLLLYPRMKEASSYHILEGTTRIGRSAFYGQEYLEEVVIASTVEDVNDSAFAETKKLFFLAFPSSVGYFGNRLTFHSSIEYIVINRTMDDGRLTVINLDESWPDIYVPNESFMDYIDDDDTQEGVRLFYPMSMMHTEIDDLFDYIVDDMDGSVTITSYKGDASYLKVPSTIDGHTVRKIDTGAFTKEGLKEVYLPVSLEHIARGAFDGISSLELITFYGGHKGDVTAHMNEQSLIELTETESNICTKIETDGAYWAYEDGCPAEEVLDIIYREVPNGETHAVYIVKISLVYYDDADFLAIEKAAFSNLEHLTSITFLGRYKDFNGGIFENTPALVDIAFQKYSPYNIHSNMANIIYLGDTFVYYPQKLFFYSYTLDSSTKNIASYAFMHSQYLNTLTVPSSVEFIDEDAFRGGSVERIVLLRSIVDDGSITDTHMSFYEGMPVIYVPDDSYEAYLEDGYWKELSDYIKRVSELE